MSDDALLNELGPVLAEQDAAWAAGDAPRFSERVLPDAVFTNIFGQQFTGRDAFEGQHAFIFSSIYAGSRLTQTIAHARRLADTVAAVDTDCEVHGAKVLPAWYASEDGVLRTKLLQIFVLRPEGWRIAAFHNVVVNPPREG